SRTHARIQALRLCCHYHCRSRATTSYSQRPIRPRTFTPQRPSCARYLECCPVCIDQSFSRRLLCQSNLFAPEPGILCCRLLSAKRPKDPFERPRTKAAGSTEFVAAASRANLSQSHDRRCGLRHGYLHAERCRSLADGVDACRP